MQFSTRSLARAALIAAMYALLTFALQPISFRAVQFRAAEALTLLPMLAAEAVPALAVGCLIANLIGGAIWYDVVFGTLATLIAALLTRRLRQRPYVAAAMPALLNGLIVGPIVYMAYMRTPGDAVHWGALIGCMGTVALGEIAVCFVLGLPLQKAMERLPKLWAG